MKKRFDYAIRARLKKKKNENFSVLRVFRDFMKNTSIHGIKYLDRNSVDRGKFGNLFWIFILILAFVGSSLMLKLFWNRYQAHPTVSVVDTFYAPSFQIPFPALTICPMVAPDSTLRLKLLQKLRLPNGITKDRAASLFKQAFEMSHPRAEMYEDRDQMNEILKLNDFHLNDFLVALRSPCENVVESCWWDHERINCLKSFKLSYTFGGLCCSFNYLLEDHVDAIRRTETMRPLRASNIGINSGLTLIFTGNQFVINDDNGTIERITTNTVGLLVFIHHSMVYPDLSNLILQAGREMQLRISAKENRKVPGLGGENEQPCAPKESMIKYFAEYWQDNCYNSCRIRASLALCNCVPWLFAPFVEKKSICGFSQMKCLRENYRKIWSVMYIEKPSVQCFCPARCDMYNYQVKHSQIPIGRKMFAPSLIYRNVSTKNAVLRMYIGEQVYDRAANLKVADEIYFLSSIGGIFSLFLGCSILSLCEIIYFSYILIVSWLRRKTQCKK